MMKMTAKIGSHVLPCRGASFPLRNTVWREQRNAYSHVTGKISGGEYPPNLTAWVTANEAYCHQRTPVWAVWAVYWRSTHPSKPLQNWPSAESSGFLAGGWPKCAKGDLR